MHSALAVPSHEVYSNVEASRSSAKENQPSFAATRTTVNSAPAAVKAEPPPKAAPSQKAAAAAPADLAPKIGPLGLQERAAPKAEPKLVRKAPQAQSLPTLPTTPEEPAGALEQKLAAGAPRPGERRKRAPNPKKKSMGRESINSWLSRENFIHSQWTHLIHPRNAGGDAGAPVVRAFNPPEPLLGRAPRDGEF